MRDRAEGWKYAKLSGHINEAEIESKLNEDETLFRGFVNRIIGEANISGSVSVGGIKETNVESILGDTTKSKTDMKISLDDGRRINISIKKSLGGQVYLIRTGRFIKGYEKQFGVEIPQEVKKAMMLFWGEDPHIEDIISTYGEKEKESIKKYEKRKQRLVATSLYNYDEKIADSLILWFKNNIDKVALYCFSRGLAKDEEDWANYIWYKNLVGDNNIDAIFDIDEIAAESLKQSETIEYGKVGGGTTIQLPFGFVQWHQGQMQFHHKYDKVSLLCKGL